MKERTSHDNLINLHPPGRDDRVFALPAFPRWYERIFWRLLGFKWYKA